MTSYTQGAPLPPASAGGPVEHATLVDALKATAAANKPGRGLRFLQQGVETFETYAELLAASRLIFGSLQELGLKKGDAMVLQISSMRDHVHCIWGCALGGITPVNISIPQVYELKSSVFQKMLGVLDNLRIFNPRILSSPQNVEPLKKLLPQTPEGKNTLVHDLTTLPPAPLMVVEPTLTGEDVLFYQLTSGSTGRSKCIPERHCAVISHLRHSIVHCSYLETDVTVNWLPFDHVVPMLTYHLCDVYLGRHAVEMPTADILADPLLWVRVMDKYRCTHSWAPNFGFKLVVKALQVCITTRTCTCMRA